MNWLDSLQRDNLGTPVEYEWTRRIANKFQAVPGEDYPKLWDALEEVSIRAAFALGVACGAWAVARLQHLADVSDAALRIEAALAATVDWRYAKLLEPDAPDSGPAPDPVAEPLWLSQLFVFDLHDFYIKSYQGVPNKGVRATALRLALLVRHITPKKAGFDKWLTASLRKAKEQYPATEAPVQEEPAVPPDFFDPEFKPSEEAGTASRVRLLSGLNPSANSYLRKPDSMHADGFEGDPYPNSR